LHFEPIRKPNSFCVRNKQGNKLPPSRSKKGLHTAYCTTVLATYLPTYLPTYLLQQTVLMIPKNKVDATIHAKRVVRGNQSIRYCVKALGVACLALVIFVFGMDMNLLEEMAGVLVHNVLAAIVLVVGLNVGVFFYDAFTVPMPGGEHYGCCKAPLLHRQRSQRSLFVTTRRKSRAKSLGSNNSNNSGNGSLLVDKTPDDRRSSSVFGLWPKRMKSLRKRLSGGKGPSDSNNHNKNKHKNKHKNSHSHSHSNSRVSNARRRAEYYTRVSTSSI